MTAITRLFLPGAGGSANFWLPVAEALPPDWVKRRLAWPGLGDEPPDPAITGIDGLTDLVSVRIMAAPGPVDLIGQSMGGLVTIRAALRHPDRIRRIVLTGTSGGVDVAGFGGADWRPAYRATYPTAAPWITETRIDHTAELCGITAPTLLLWGGADPISPPAVGRHLAELLPDASLVIIEGGDHAFPHAMPGPTAAHIARHLA